MAKTTTLLPLYGTNRMNATRPAEFLRGCEWIGIPFVGGFCEVPHFKARTIVCNDLNRHAMNLASVVSDSFTKDLLILRLQSALFHPMLLLACQRACRKREECEPTDELPKDYDWAFDYFVCAWMARNHSAGTDKEFDAVLSIRWDAGGGDSCVRFR